MKLVKEFKAGKLYTENNFLVPVLEGSNLEMGEQYGALMLDTMQPTFDLLVKPEIDNGDLDKEAISLWVNRAYGSGSIRTKEFYDGVALGTGWPLEHVVLLDQIMEYGIYKEKIHSFAGCTSIVSYGEQSKDGGMYIGRTLDWSPAFNKFPTVFTVRKPNDGSYKMATAGWPGMYAAFTAVNEHGVYLDIHDGTSMGGSLVFLERPSLLNTLTDFMSESADLQSLKNRFNGTLNSVSIIFTIADKKNAASAECSSLNGNRIRIAEDDAFVVVNSFLNKDWGLGKRETVSNSLRRFSNMTDRLAEKRGEVDAKMTRELMDIRLFNEDGTFKENGGCLKPTKQDADLTNYQTVFDINDQKVWIKIPVPEYFADWTEIDLKTLWK
ncbi:C45 family peptidase [Flammeovirga sp. SJP92]|uniref:C45 family autoproteolytic acyltransferase/hydolase n=1 Tax=Flammeovirga sp. SJP92 TaxID=1775430 RepID=UPI0007892BDB|nr:C45 family peptidase [Flammeovirga sp. SJP92]KXX71577.1 hypothetical protein AVL50_04705 [Flammeovirga sp. SJP92]